MSENATLPDRVTLRGSRALGSSLLRGGLLGRSLLGGSLLRSRGLLGGSLLRSRLGNLDGDSLHAVFADGRNELLTTDREVGVGVGELLDGVLELLLDAGGELASVLLKLGDASLELGLSVLGVLDRKSVV